MRNWGPIVICLAVMATVALIGRGYIALDAKVPNWGDALDALVATVSVVTAIITYTALGLTKASAEAATVAADAARASSVSVKHVERAYVDIGYILEGWKDGEGSFRVTCVNYGKTPGKLRKVYCHILDSAVLALPPVNECLDLAWDVAITLGENATGIIAMAPVVAGQPVTFFSLVIYEDIFGQSWMSTAALFITIDENGLATNSYVGAREWNRMH